MRRKPSAAPVRETVPNRSARKVQEQIELDRRSAFPKAAEVKKYRKYLNGEVESKLTDGQKQLLEGILGEDFDDNACNQIVSEYADRVILKRFEVENEDV